MYYVIQVASGMEERAEEQINVVVDRKLYDRCFHPMRHMKKKLRGELKHVPAFTRMLGKDAEQFIPLSKEEVEWLTRIMRTAGDGMEVGLSQVSVSEDDVITILSGPLKSMEGYIRKIDLHRRIAKVEVEFMNRKTVIHLGIEMVGKKRETMAG